MSIQLSSLTTTQLHHAADLKEEIDALNKELASLLGASAPVTAKAPGKMSASARAKIGAAQKARWAKVNAAKPATSATKAPVKKGKMSAAAKARLSALAKARWAKIKASGKKKL
jgi:hypothetical protein